MAFALFFLGGDAFEEGNVAEARSLLEETIRLWRPVGEKAAIAHSTCALGFITAYQANYAEALALYAEGLELHCELENKIGIGDALYGMALVTFLSQGDPMTIHTLTTEALAYAQGAGGKEMIADCICLLGRLALSRGDLTAARSLLEESVMSYRELQERQGIALGLAALGKLALAEGNPSTAQTLYEESLAIAQEGHQKWHIASCLEGMASAVAAQGQCVRAVRLWSAAAGLRGAIGLPLPHIDQIGYESSMAAARTRLSVKLFASAWEEGQMMTLEQILVARDSPVRHQQAASSSPSLVKAPSILPGSQHARWKCYIWWQRDSPMLRSPSNWS